MKRRAVPMDIGGGYNVISGGGGYDILGGGRCGMGGGGPRSSGIDGGRRKNLVCTSLLQAMGCVAFIASVAAVFFVIVGLPEPEPRGSGVLMGTEPTALVMGEPSDLIGLEPSDIILGPEPSDYLFIGAGPSDLCGGPSPTALILTLRDAQALWLGRSSDVLMEPSNMFFGEETHAVLMDPISDVFCV